MGWREAFRTVIETVPENELADLVAELARADAIARQQIYAPPEQENGNEPPDDEILNSRQAMKFLGAESVRWVQRHCKELGGYKLAGRYKFPRRKLERYRRSLERLS